jgi:signal peptidase I
MGKRKRRTRRPTSATSPAATPQRGSPDGAPRARPSALQYAREWLKALAAALVIWFFLRALLVEGYHIPSGSMENTLLEGDVLFANKAVFGARLPIVGVRLPAFREPRRRDIVIFESPVERGVTVVKRVIGVPGDTIAMVGGAVRVDGRSLAEPYTKWSDPLSDPEVPEMRSWQPRFLVNRDPRTYRPTLQNWGPVVVPPDSFFVMGDHRDSSYDSRYWGFLGRDRIRGKPLFIYYSHDAHAVTPLPFLTAIRWARIFTAPR